MPYEEQCYNANSAIDTDCVSEASDAFVSILLPMKRRDELKYSIQKMK